MSASILDSVTDARNDEAVMLRTVAASKAT